jgi:hypothetical protein
MSTASSADSNEADADPFVSPFGRCGYHMWDGKSRRGGSARTYRGLKKRPPICRVFFTHQRLLSGSLIIVRHFS